MVLLADTRNYGKCEFLSRRQIIGILVAWHNCTVWPACVGERRRDVARSLSKTPNRSASQAPPGGFLQPKAPRSSVVHDVEIYCSPSIPVIHLIRALLTSSQPHCHHRKSEADSTPLSVLVSKIQQSKVLRTIHLPYPQHQSNLPRATQHGPP